MERRIGAMFERCRRNARRYGGIGNLSGDAQIKRSVGKKLNVDIRDFKLPVSRLKSL